MNQGLIWRLAASAALLLSATAAAVGDDAEPAGEEQLPAVFEELLPVASTTSLLAHESCAPGQGTSCAPAPTCCAEAPGNCANGCGYSCCDQPICHEDYCGPSCCTFIVGTEFTFLAPQGDGLRVRARGDDLTLPAVYRVSEMADFDGMTFAPRIWAGFQGEEWGFIGRFWYLSDSDDQFHAFDQLAGGSPGSYTIDRTKAYTVDWEFTRACCRCDNKYDFAIGGRYALLEAGAAADVSGLANGGDDFFRATAISDINFDGFGVTSAIGGRHPIGNCCGCIYLLWNLRGSVLWGDTSNSVQTTATAIGIGTNAASIDAAIVKDDGTMFIVEAQLGAQWEHELQCLPAATFLRLAAEYQFWDLDSGSAGSFSTAATPDASALARAESGNYDLSLLGFTIGTGLTW